MSVINRRKLTSANYEAFGMDEIPKYTLMDTFNLNEYEANGFKEVTTAEKSLNAYYNQQSCGKTGMPKSLEPREVLGDFSAIEAGIVISVQKKSLNMFVRNFVLHQVTKRIVLDFPALAFDLCTSKPRVLIATENGKLKIIDYTHESGNIELSCDTYNAFQGAQFCSHNMIATIAGPEVMTYLISIQKN